MSLPASPLFPEERKPPPSPPLRKATSWKSVFLLSLPSSFSFSGGVKMRLPLFPFARTKKERFFTFPLASRFRPKASKVRFSLTYTELDGRDDIPSAPALLSRLVRDPGGGGRLPTFSPSRSTSYGFSSFRQNKKTSWGDIGFLLSLLLLFFSFPPPA